MTEFISRKYGNEGYEVIIKTDSEADYKSAEEFARKLIDHAKPVTDNNVGSKWISVKEHLPQENEPEGATCEQVQVLLDNGVVSTGWCNRHTKLWWHLNYGETHFVGYDYEHTPVIAWQPFTQPPEGE